MGDLLGAAWRVGAFAVLCAAGLVVGCHDAGACVSEAGGAVAGRESMRVMSFNIRYGTARDGVNRWEVRRPRVVRLVQRFRPDVVGVQEALRFQVDVLAEGLPDYGWFGVGREDGATRGEHVPVFYRRGRYRELERGTFWFSETPAAPGSKSWGNAIPRICTWGRLEDRATGGSLFVYNVHLDHASQRSRERSADLLVARIAGRSPRDPVVVTGDFNAAETNPAIVRLTAGAGDAALRDAFREIHPTVARTNTFNGFGLGIGGGRIDYVFVSPGWRVVDAFIPRGRIDGAFASDHFPVVADLLPEG